MLNRLRAQLVVAATIALMLAFGMVMVPVYFLVSQAFTAQIETVLDVLLANGGTMPGNIEISGRRFVMINPELQYETRYFSVLLDRDGNAVELNTASVYSIDDREAEEIAEQLYAEGRRSGQYAYDGSYYLFKSAVAGDGTRMVFADGTSRIWIIRTVLYYMLLVGFVILLFFSVILGFLSKRIVEPFIRNTEKQKQFITNASHELKTPLAVISANTEMQELAHGSDKWTESTMRQIQRLNALISELVTLSKLEEKDELVLTEVDVSEVVREQAESFSQVILQQGKRFETAIAEGLHIRSEARSVQELTSILLDNAAKYCDDGGLVKTELSAKSGGKSVRLSVYNSYADGAGVDYRRFFERFYREDASHNSKKSGFGIGLSIAQELCKRLGAKLQVSYAEGMICFSILFR